MRIAKLRLALLAMAAGMALSTAACKTAAPADESNHVQSAMEAARAAHTLPMPPDPLFALSLRPAQLSEAAAHLERRLRPENASASYSDDSDDSGDTGDSADGDAEDRVPAAYKYLASRMIARLMAGAVDPDALLQANNPAFRFEQLDRGRALYVAASSAPYRAWLRHLRLAVPVDSTTLVERGMSLRLVLPADDPEALAAELRRHCNPAEEAESGTQETDPEEAADRWLAGQCSAVARTAATDSWVTVDLVVDAADNLDQSPEQVWGEVVSPSGDAGLFERPTPASVAFFDPDAPVSVYGRSGAWWQLGAMLEAVDPQDPGRARAHERPAHIRSYRRVARERARQADTDPMQVIRRLQRRLGELARTANFDGQEYEDATLRLQLNPAGDTLAFDLIRTYTDRGAAIAEATFGTDSAPTLEGLGMLRPLLEVEWRGDMSDGLARAKEPAWLERLALMRSDYQRSDYFEEHLLPWGPAAALTFYPAATAKALYAGYVDDEATPVDTIQRLKHLKAMRAALDLEADESAKFGIRVRAAAVLLIPTASNLDANIESWGAVLESLGVPTSVEVTPRGEDQLVVKFSAGLDNHAFDEPNALEATGWSVHVAPRRIREAIVGSGVTDNWDVDGTLPRHITLRGRSDGRASLHRLTLGDDVLSTPAPPELDIALRPADAPSDCLRSAVERFAALNEARERQQWRRYLPGLRSVADQLDTAAEECPADSRETGETGETAETNESADLRWMHRLALDELADMQSRLARWEAAQATYRAACETGDTSACRHAEAVEQRAESHRLPRVRGVRVEDGPLPEAFLMVDAEGASFEGRQVNYSDATFGDSLAELVRSEKIITPTATYRYSTKRTLPLAPDATVPFDRLQRIVAAAREGDHSTGIGTEGVFWLVHPPEDQGDDAAPYFLLTQFKQSRDGERFQRDRNRDQTHAPLQVTIGSEGVRLAHDDEALTPAEGCPKDGPTVCGDLDQLRARLLAFKEKHPELRSARVTVAPSVDYRRFTDVVAELTQTPPGTDAPSKYSNAARWRGGVFPEVYLENE